jgi:hypothetical protein
LVGRTEGREEERKDGPVPSTTHLEYLPFLEGSQEKKKIRIEGRRRD